MNTRRAPRSCSCGSQINAYGEPAAILHEDDLQEFLKRVDRVTDYYNAIIVLPDTPLPGEKLRSENAADLVGLKAAVQLAASKENADLTAFFRMYASLYIQTIWHNPFLFFLLFAPMQQYMKQPGMSIKSIMARSENPR